MPFNRHLDSRTRRVSRLPGILATADRPMRVFDDLGKAQRRIDRQPGG